MLARLKLEDFTLDLDEGFSESGCTAIFGPSGSGKSTLLRLIAGFSRPDVGRISFGGEVWCDMAVRTFVPPHKRSVGYMLQEARLFPHLTAEDNLLYADRRSRERADRYPIAEIIDAFDLAELLPRDPASLSGGERQRVALGRTLLTRPELLLLDEPLSALDRDRKADIVPYLQDLPARFGLPVLLVSHDVEEVSRLADHVMLMNRGRVEAAGPTAKVLETFGASAAGEALEAGTILAGKVTRHDTEFHLTYVDIGDAVLSLPLNLRRETGEEVSVRIEPQNVAIATVRPEETSIRNIVPGKVAEITPQPDSHLADLCLDIGGRTLRARITRASLHDLKLSKGQEVFALVKTASFHL